MRRTRPIFFALVGAAIVAGCFLRAVPDLTGGSDDGGLVEGGDATPNGDAGIDGAFACPVSKAGPLLVAVPAPAPFCMDATEVTAAQYNAWTPRSLALLPSGCATTFRDASALISDPNPVDFPGWCDAYAFCAYAGKRLCTTAELTFACTLGGAHQWPYGDAFAGSACNGAEQGLDATWPSGSHASCEGAFRGLFDLVGNTDEWTGTCDDPPNGGTLDTVCDVFGGYYLTTGASCKPSTRQQRQSNAGFRCCAL